MAGYKVPAINTTEFTSEIGHRLCKGHPFAVMYNDIADKRIFSLRSDINGIDVSIIARMFAGGGHYHAAGFSMPKPKVF